LLVLGVEFFADNGGWVRPNSTRGFYEGGPNTRDSDILPVSPTLPLPPALYFSKLTIKQARIRTLKRIESVAGLPKCS
jgi:hypothetical protein